MDILALSSAFGFDQARLAILLRHPPGSCAGALGGFQQLVALFPLGVAEGNIAGIHFRLFIQQRKDTLGAG